MKEKLNPKNVLDNNTLDLENDRPNLRLEINNEAERSLEEFMPVKQSDSNQETRNLKKALDENVDNIRVRKPKYGRTRISTNERLEKIKQSSSKIPRLIERIEIIKKCLPYPNGEVFVNKINQIREEIESLLKNESELISIGENEGMQDSFYQLTVKPENQLATIEREFLNDAENKLNEFFRPLVNTARSDVRRFLIKHFNTTDIPFTEAQKNITEKWRIEKPIVFRFHTNLFNVGDKTDRSGVLGKTDGESIEVFMNDITFLTNDKLDEGELLDTLIHEIVHTVSDISEKGFGLEQEAVINNQDKNEPESLKTKTRLNELMTQVITMEIASKHFKKDEIHPINFKRTEQQQITGYQHLVKPFLELKTRYPEEINQLIKIATNTMLQGNFDNLKKFLFQNKNIADELERIIKY